MQCFCAALVDASRALLDFYSRDCSSIDMELTGHDCLTAFLSATQLVTQPCALKFRCPTIMLDADVVLQRLTAESLAGSLSVPYPQVAKRLVVMQQCSTTWPLAGHEQSLP